MKPRMLLLAAVATVFGSVLNLAAERADKLKVLVVTGGHGFARGPFFQMFKDNAAITFTHAEHSRTNAAAYERADLLDYDVVVLYDMPASITEAQKARFLALFDKGIGLVVLHHALASYQHWPDYERIIGGRYPEEDGKSGVVTEQVGYQHDVDVPVVVVAKDHPVTAGLKDYTLRDEIYWGYRVGADVTPLVSTTHPKSGRPLAWSRAEKNSRVVFIQSGHGPETFTNANFRQLLAQSIRWTAKAVRTAKPISVSSPDGAVELRIYPRDARWAYEVFFHGRPVIESSPLAFSVDDVNLTSAAEPGEVKRYEVRETYPWRGAHSQATNHCNGASIPLRHARSGTQHTLEVRAFNDGVAFRHVVPAGDKSRVPDEATKFILPAGSTVWHHDLEGHYEDVHVKSAVADLEAGEWCAPPLTFKLPGGAGYASITEAALMNYSGMALKADGQRGFDLVLGDKHSTSYPFRLRYSNDVERVSKPAAVDGAITSPWRVVMVGADLNALVNSDIVHNLCPPPDPKLFPKGFQTDWIKSGRAVWKYLDGGQNSFEQMKDFSRWAGELGFEYHVIEGFWSRWSDEQVKELVDYSRQRGVGLFFWKHSRQLRTPEAREEFFAKLSRLGVVGAKIDFFDHEHKEIIDLYAALLEAAVRHRILVNFHGANKPTGESRTWPNELTREGVRGMEARRLRERARHNTTLPFTRYLAGHGDYTPVHFGERRGDTTWAHQIATAAVFDEPLLTYGAHPTNLLANPVLEMIKSIPAVWDETTVLPMSEIGELVVFARRRGDTWFLAILNGPEARTLNVPLTFLAPGDYRAMLVRDHETESAAVQVENTTKQRTGSLAIILSSGGGFIARFSQH